MGTRDRRNRVLARVEEAGAVWVADLAAEFQVSEMTVRRDLDRLAADDLVVRVRGGATRSDAPADTDGSDSPSATYSIGIVLPTSDRVYRSILTGIDETLTRARATSTLLVSNYSPELERQLVGELLSNGVDGLLFGPTLDEEKPDREFLSWLTTLPVPVALVERRLPDSWPGPPLSSVRTSFPRGLALGLTHLTELGHAGVAFFGHATRLNVEVLQRKWEELLSGFDLNVSASPMVIDRDYQHWKSSLEPERVLSRIRDTGATALICRDDPVALTMVHCARSMGLRIPDDLSVVTYDNEIATMCDPPLTAVSPPKEALGNRASTLLLELIRDHRRRIRRPAVHLEMEPSVVVRASTSAPPA